MPMTWSKADQHRSGEFKRRTSYVYINMYYLRKACQVIMLMVPGTQLQPRTQDTWGTRGVRSGRTRDAGNSHVVNRPRTNIGSTGISVSDKMSASWIRLAHLVLNLSTNDAALPICRRWVHDISAHWCPNAV